MAKLIGTQRMVLRAVLDAQSDSGAYVEDTSIAQATMMTLSDVRHCLVTLDGEEFVDLARTEKGLSVSATARGRQALRLFEPYQQTVGPLHRESPALRLQTGREKALLIGISDYVSQDLPNLPKISHGVRDVARLLGSNKGDIAADNVTCLVDETATLECILSSLETTFYDARPADARFVYMAGRGAVDSGDYFYIAHDTNISHLDRTALSLKSLIKIMKSSASRKVFVWLDFYDTGSFSVGTETVLNQISQSLSSVAGQEKLVLVSYHQPNNIYNIYNLHDYTTTTEYLLRGLSGEAMQDGEVTVNSLYEYIERQVAGGRQRLMLFGQLLGRFLLTHQDN